MKKANNFRLNKKDLEKVLGIVDEMPMNLSGVMCNTTIPTLDLFEDAKSKLPTRDELWIEAKEGLEIEEFLDDTSLFLFQNNILYSDRSKIEKKVIDLFLEKLKAIIIKFGISELKAEKILYKLISKFEFQIADYLGIIYEKYYLHYKMHNTYPFVSPVLSSEIPYDSEYYKTEEILSRLSSLFNLNSYSIACPFPNLSTESYVSDLAPKFEEYSESESIYIDASLFNGVKESIKKFTKKIFSNIDIFRLRYSSRIKKSSSYHLLEI